jgi:hypothetical protein
MKTEKPMNVSDRFAALSKEWAGHCQKVVNSSNIEDSLKHPSFRGLIDLGPAAVPLIMERYTTDELCPWEFVLEGITGVKCVEDRNVIVWGEVTKKRLAWWEKEKAAKK